MRRRSYVYVGRDRLLPSTIVPNLSGVRALRFDGAGGHGADGGGYPGPARRCGRVVRGGSERLAFGDGLSARAVMSDEDRSESGKLFSILAVLEHVLF